MQPHVALFNTLANTLVTTAPQPDVWLTSPHIGHAAAAGALDGRLRWARGAHELAGRADASKRQLLHGALAVGTRDRREDGQHV